MIFLHSRRLYCLFSALALPTWLAAQSVQLPSGEPSHVDKIPILGADSNSSNSLNSTAAASSASSALPAFAAASSADTPKGSVLHEVQLFNYQPLQGRSPPRLQLDKSDSGDKSILSMDPYFTFGRRIQLSKEDILSPAGRVSVAKHRYLNPIYQKTLGPLMAIPGFVANPLWGLSPNTPEAMLLYEEDERIRRNQNMNDLINLDRFGRDSAKGDRSPKRPLSQTEQKNPSDDLN